MDQPTPIKHVCVFCGSRSGARPDYRDAAAALGATLAEHGVGLVYGGGNVGLMGTVSDACLDAGGTVTGIIPDFMIPLELANNRIQDLRVVKSMHERKALMAKLSDAFISLPGGIGTFEECLEQMAWWKLKIHRKPSGLLNVAGYYDGFIDFLKHSADAGFYDHPSIAELKVAADIDELLDMLGIT